jgi:hypothetical protein
MDKVLGYAKQPSTWLGLTKIAAAVGLTTGTQTDAIAGAVIAIFGVIDVFRNEKK